MEADLLPQGTEITEDVALKFSPDPSKIRTDTQDERLLLSQRRTVFSRTTDNPEMEYIRSYSETEPLMYSSDSTLTTFSCKTFFTAQPQVR